MLTDWRKLIFDTVDRKGKTQEIIYCNYPEPKFLHQYDFIGDGYIKRQNVKRKIKRFENKISELPPYERHLFIQKLISKYKAEVQHFLTVRDLTGKNNRTI